MECNNNDNNIEKKSNTIETLKCILSNNKNKNNQSYFEDRPIRENHEYNMPMEGGKENQFDLEKYVKSNFAEIFEKINELNKMATHLVKQNEKIVVL
jgi:hypothetical protein